MVNQTAQITQSDSDTGHFVIRAGQLVCEGRYDSQKMLSAISLSGPKIRDLDLLNLIRRTNLDYVGVIRLINEIQLIDHIDTIDTVDTINTLDTINTVDTINTIGKIDEISTGINVVSSSSLLQNGDFKTKNLAGWYHPPTTIYTLDNTGENSVKIPPGDYIRQSVLPIVGAAFKLAFWGYVTTAPDTLRIALYYTDGTVENCDETMQAATTPHFVQPTTKKRLSYIFFQNIGTTDMYVSKILAYHATDDLDANLEVLPKTKGKTILIKQAQANNNTVNVYTVSAGKTFYCTSANISIVANAAAVLGSGALTAGGVNMLLAYVATSALLDRQNSNQAAAFAVPLAFAAGTVFNVVSPDVAIYAYATLSGWEE